MGGYPIACCGCYNREDVTLLPMLYVTFVLSVCVRSLWLKMRSFFRSVAVLHRTKSRRKGHANVFFTVSSPRSVRPSLFFKPHTCWRPDIEHRGDTVSVPVKTEAIYLRTQLLVACSLFIQLLTSFVGLSNSLNHMDLYNILG